jgi:hypothetical protein
MKVIRVCMHCRQTHERDIDINSAQLYDWMSGTLIQVAMPHLSDDDREFVVSGTHPECWDKIFPPEENLGPDLDHPVVPI